MNAEEIKSDGGVMVKGAFFTMKIEDQDQFTGVDSEPSYIDLKITINCGDGRTVEFVAMDSEVDEIVKGIAHARAAKQLREMETRIENARVDVIEELTQEFEDRLTCEMKNMVMERYADLYHMTYDEVMNEKEKRDAAAEIDTPDE